MNSSRPGPACCGFRGAEAKDVPLVEAAITAARVAGHGLGVQWSQCIPALLFNGLGHYETGLARAQLAADEAPELFVSMWALPELIEAAARSGNAQAGTPALERLADITRAGGTDFGLGIQARSRALLDQSSARS